MSTGTIKPPTNSTGTRSIPVTKAASPPGALPAEAWASHPDHASPWAIFTRPQHLPRRTKYCTSRVSRQLRNSSSVTLRFRLRYLLLHGDHTRNSHARLQVEQPRYSITTLEGTTWNNLDQGASTRHAYLAACKRNRCTVYVPEAGFGRRTTHGPYHPAHPMRSPRIYDISHQTTGNAPGVGVNGRGGLKAYISSAK